MTEFNNSNLDLQKIADQTLSVSLGVSSGILDLINGRNLVNEVVVNTFRDRQTGEPRELKRVKTNADRISHELLVKGLREKFPEYPILSEEERSNGRALASHVAPGQPYFIIDPIDGTAHLQKGTGQWLISIALCCDGVPLIGVSAVPSFSRIFIGIAGEPSSYIDTEDRSLNKHIVNTVERDLEDLVVSICDSLDLGGKPDLVAQKFAELNGWRNFKLSGSAYRYLEVAQGIVDLVFHNSGNLHWDKVAQQVNVEGKGGKVVYINWEDSAVNLTETPPATYPLDWVKDQGHLVVSASVVKQLEQVRFDPAARTKWEVFFD